MFLKPIFENEKRAYPIRFKPYYNNTLVGDTSNKPKPYIMKYRFLILILFISAAISAQEKKDSIAIVQLLKDDYSTLQTHDFNAHKKNCTDNYLLIEYGEIWDMNKEADSFKENAHTVFERTDYFDFKYIKVLKNIAYAVYSLKSDFVEKGKSEQMHWSESAIFRKIEGVWKIELIHSSPHRQKSN
tara:strand:+ start:5424 stop:5981 length:558 start_codon:yes stop_codon:yes gene_type:complete